MAASLAQTTPRTVDPASLDILGFRLRMDQASVEARLATLQQENPTWTLTKKNGFCATDKLQALKAGLSRAPTKCTFSYTLGKPLATPEISIIMTEDYPASPGTMRLVEVEYLTAEFKSKADSVAALRAVEAKYGRPTQVSQISGTRYLYCKPEKLHEVGAICSDESRGVCSAIAFMCNAFPPIGDYSPGEISPALLDVEVGPAFGAAFLRLADFKYASERATGLLNAEQAIRHMKIQL